MLINKPLLDLAFNGFKTVYTQANLEAPSGFEKIAMPDPDLCPSANRYENHAGIGNLPSMREWPA